MITNAANQPLVRVTQIGFALGALAALILILAGKALAPSERLAGLAAAAGVVIVYGLLGGLASPSIERANPSILRAAVAFGLLAALVFTVEILLEYVLLPADNSLMGTLEFGLVFVAMFASGLWMAYRGHRLGDSVLTAVGVSMISALTWLIVLLAVFYAFRGTPQQAQVLRAEGDFDDFARSGGADFNTFVMEDFMGAAFFHLLLSPLAACLLGLAGGIVGKGLARLSNRQKQID